MYNSFYGLSEKPFEIIPDPKFLYLSPTHQEALENTLKGIKNRSPFTSITGEVGTGKTMLIYSIFIRLDENVKTSFIFHPSISFTELIRNILQDLDQEVIGKSKEAFLRQLNEYLLKKLAMDKTLAVFIDEAQNLPKEVMEELGEFKEKMSGISDRLQIVFVGQPEFEGKLNFPGLRQLSQKIRIKYQIRPLTKEESMEYIDYRLTIVGSRASNVFTPNAIAIITDHARGIPRVINILCDNALRIGYGLSKKRVDADIIREVIREMEGPISHKSILSRIVTPLTRFHWMPHRLISYQKRISFGILSLLCLVGFILLIHGSLKQKPANTRSIESIKEHRIDTEIASKEPLSQTMKQEIFEVPSASSHHDWESQGLQPIPPPFGSRSPEHEEGVFAEVIAVRKGQTISSMAQKYYGMANPTLVDLILDFNPEITNADLIQINQTIKIPKITKEWLITQSPNLTFKVCVGTFRTPDFVAPYKNEPTLKGKRIEVLPRKVSPKDTWHRVMVGPFDNRDEASKAIDLLKGKGLLPLFGGILKTA